MPMSDNPEIDKEDAAWLSGFLGKSIPAEAVIEGFVAVISYMGPDGGMYWKPYATIDNGIRCVGLLTAAATQMSLEMSQPMDGD